MAYLTRIGHIPENKGKTGSRGYHVFRRGNVVSALWGPVNVVRKSGKVMFTWAYIQKAQYQFKSIDSAKRKLDEIIKRQEAQGYTKLAANTGISRLGGCKINLLPLQKE